MLTRRFFLRGSAMVMAGAGSVPFWLGRAAAYTRGKRKILGGIFQRGAAAGLNMVGPFAEKRYRDERQSAAYASRRPLCYRGEGLAAVSRRPGYGVHSGEHVCQLVRPAIEYRW